MARVRWKLHMSVLCDFSSRTTARSFAWPRARLPDREPAQGTHYNFSFSKTIIYITYLLSILLSDAETREIPDRWRVYDSLTSYMDMQL